MRRAAIELTRLSRGRFAYTRGMDRTALRFERMPGDGVTLHVARAGEGPPVLLLHGFPEHWYGWRHQIPALAAAGFSVLAPDLRGYNLSDKPASRDAYRLRHLAADVAALVRATGARRAHVVGHDWGGIIAWAFAAWHPERLGKLAILNAPHPGRYLEEVRRPAQMLRSWYVLLFQLPRLPEMALSASNYRGLRTMFRSTAVNPHVFSPRDLDEYVSAMSRPGALTAALNYYRANVARGGLASVRSARTDAETLVIWGERDPALGAELLDGLERFAPDLRVRRIPTAGHWVQHEAAEDVTRALVEFLAA